MGGAIRKKHEEAPWVGNDEIRVENTAVDVGKATVWNLQPKWSQLSFWK